jgi:hypothetical protein
MMELVSANRHRSASHLMVTSSTRTIPETLGAHTPNDTTPARGARRGSVASEAYRGLGGTPDTGS